MTRRQRELPAEVGEVGQLIERWRGAREKQSAMPADLWAAAAQLAVKHGVHRISKAFRLSYESLKRRTVEMLPGGSGARGGGSGFVELGAPPPSVVPSAQGGNLELEVCDGEGQRMAIRLQGCSEVDVVSMVDSFWRRGR